MFSLLPLPDGYVSILSEHFSHKQWTAESKQYLIPPPLQSVLQTGGAGFTQISSGPAWKAPPLLLMPSQRWCMCVCVSDYLSRFPETRHQSCVVYHSDTPYKSPRRLLGGGGVMKLWNTFLRCDNLFRELCLLISFQLTISFVSPSVLAEVRRFVRLRVWTLPGTATICLSSCFKLMMSLQSWMSSILEINKGEKQ